MPYMYIHAVKTLIRTYFGFLVNFFMNMVLCMKIYLKTGTIKCYISVTFKYKCVCLCRGKEREGE